MSLDIKICGLKTPETVRAVLDHGASHVGFIFFAKSPRHLEPEEAGALARLAAGRAKTVAVTVDADDAYLDEIFEKMRPDVLQFHGKEPPERVFFAKKRYNLPVLRAFSVSETQDFQKISPFVGVADRFLFDAKPPKGSDLPGGNGVSFDWTMLAALDPGIDYMLSGGLNAVNVGDALRLANPPGIDISSGVESQPGVKDTALIEEFFKAVRTARAKAA